MSESMMQGRSIREFGQALRQGTVTAGELAEQVIANYERFDHSLADTKAFIVQRCDQRLHRPVVPYLAERLSSGLANIQFVVI